MSKFKGIPSLPLGSINVSMPEILPDLKDIRQKQIEDAIKENTDELIALQDQLAKQDKKIKNLEIVIAVLSFVVAVLSLIIAALEFVLK